MLEVEVYDTGAPRDSVSGNYPLKARARRVEGCGVAALTESSLQMSERDVAQTEVTYDAGTLGEVVVEEVREPPWRWGTWVYITLAAMAAAGVCILIYHKR